MNWPPPIISTSILNRLGSRRIMGQETKGRTGGMKRASLILAALVGIVEAREARAQFFVSRSVVVGPSGAFSSSVRVGPHRSFGAYRYRAFSPFYYYPYSYWGYPEWDTGIYYPSPPAQVLNPPTPAAAPQPRPAEEEAPKGRLIILPRKDEGANVQVGPLPGKEAGMFRPVQPEDRARALQPMPADEPKAPPAPPAPAEAAPAPVDPLSRAKRAFAAREYGRAERQFQQLTQKDPETPLGYFLLAQAQFALDKYEEAVQSIQTGLRLQPDWPKADFHPAPLYGEHRDDFKEQLEHLRIVLESKPADPALLFLYAYQLWFAGCREEAKPIFQRAAEAGSDKNWIELFLQAK
jgi:Tetratricopeptide repeat